MVVDQLDALLGEHLMPLRARRPGADEPHLLAVDASGQPVVVEIVAVLDDEAAIRALRHAGHAAKMSTRDLAQAYTGGADRFATHLAAFRLTVPSTALLSTFVRGGARLLLVCSHISPGMDDVLEFLLQPGWQVDVLHAQVVVEPDGNRVVELSPVSRSTPPQRAVDPLERRHDPFEEPFDPTPLYRVQRRPDPELYRPVPPATPEPAPPVSWSSTPTRPVWPTERTVDWSEQWPGGAPSVEPSWPRPVPRPTARPASRGASAAAPQPAVRAPRQSAWAPQAPAWPAPRPAARPVVPPAFAVPYNDVQPTAPDPVLAAVAATLQAPAVLVWCPQGATECYESLLHADGTLEMADGSLYWDVESATRAISGLTGPLDAWQAWHVDSLAGSTLAVLAERAFPGQF
jgi:hypothetical protein